MTNSHEAGRSPAIFTRRTLFASALALAIAGPAVVIPSATRAADQPEATPQRRAWHEAQERHGRLKEDMIRDALRLTADQQKDWQAIQDKQEAQRRARRHSWTELRRVLEAELAKPDPDLARVASVHDAMMERNLKAQKEIEAMRLKLYASFSPEQKTVVRDFLKLRLARGGHRGGHERGWRGAYHGKTGTNEKDL